MQGQGTDVPAVGTAAHSLGKQELLPFILGLQISACVPGMIAVLCYAGMPIGLHKHPSAAGQHHETSGAESEEQTSTFTSKGRVSGCETVAVTAGFSRSGANPKPMRPVSTPSKLNGRLRSTKPQEHSSVETARNLRSASHARTNLSRTRQSA